MSTREDEKQTIIKWLDNYGASLERCPEWSWDDDDVVRAAVSRKGFQLQYASSRLRDDETTARLLFNNQFCVGIEHVSERLKDDDMFMGDAIARYHGCYEHASERMKLKHDVVIGMLLKLQKPKLSAMLDYIPDALIDSDAFAGECLAAGVDVAWVAAERPAFAASVSRYVHQQPAAVPHSSWCEAIGHEGRVASPQTGKQHSSL